MYKALIVAGLAAVIGCGLTACKSQKQRAGEASEATLSDFQQQLGKMPGRIDAMLKTGFELGSGTNTKKADTLRTFSKQLDEIEQDARMVASENDKAMINVQNYFLAWTKESRRITDQAKREQAAANIRAGRSNLEVARQYIEVGSKEYRRMMTLARELETGLKADLSKSTTTWFSERFTALNDAAIGAKSRVERLDEQITEALTK